ncbi:MULTISPECIES: double-CXXCG motif protein [Myxococcus]|uniref:SitI6 family double-CXXCG motif immunity protein n=2 Tax=Myxococcaceae TaxID=31 RepID=UPI00278BFDF8|nr:double-CXXCG motif protein [Myxococcus xanthus]
MYPYPPNNCKQRSATMHAWSATQYFAIVYAGCSPSRRGERLTGGQRQDVRMRRRGAGVVHAEVDAAKARHGPCHALPAVRVGAALGLRRAVCRRSALLARLCGALGGVASSPVSDGSATTNWATRARRTPRFLPRRRMNCRRWSRARATSPAWRRHRGWARLREQVRPQMPPGFALMPETKFGPMTGRASGTFGQLHLQAWTLSLRREALKQLRQAGLQGLNGCPMQLKRSGRNPPELLELQLTPCGRVHPDCLPSVRSRSADPRPRTTTHQANRSLPPAKRGRCGYISRTAI